MSALNFASISRVDLVAADGGRGVLLRDFAGEHLLQKILQPVASERLADDVEHLVPELAAHVLDLAQQCRQDVALPGVRGDEVEDVDVARLADPVDATHALLEPVGVPRDVVVDHQVAELEVDALAGGLGGDHDLRSLAEVLLRCDSLPKLQATVDDCDVEVAAELLDEVVEGVLVLGEDQQLLRLIVSEPFLGDDVEQLVQLAFGSGRFGVLGLDEQRSKCLDSASSSATVVRQPLLECLLLEFPQLVLVQVGDASGSS